MALSKNDSSFLLIITVLLAMLTAMAPLGIDSYLSSMPDMAKDFNVRINKIELTLTVYFLGLALGNFLGGPISDAFGRKTLTLTGILVYLISALLIPFANSIEFVLGLRALQALGGGFAIVTPMIFIRDWFEGKKVARLATIINMIMMISPLLAPVIGTSLAHYFGWKSIFYFFTGYALTVGFLVYFLVPESRDKNLISNRLSLTEIALKYKVLFSSKPSVYILLSTAFSMAGMYTFITAGSYIYLNYFGFSREYFPLLFGANVLLNLILSFSNNILLKKYPIKSVFSLGVMMQVAAGILLLITSLQEHVAFIPFFIGIVWFTGSMGMILGNGTAILLNLVPEISGSASAMIGLTRFLFGSFAGSLFALFHTSNLIPVGAIMLLCAVLAGFMFLLYQKSIKLYVQKLVI